LVCRLAQSISSRRSLHALMRTLQFDMYAFHLRVGPPAFMRLSVTGWFGTQSQLVVSTSTPSEPSFG